MDHSLGVVFTGSPGVVPGYLVEELKNLFQGVGVQSHVVSQKVFGDNVRCADAHAYICDQVLPKEAVKALKEVYERRLLVVALTYQDSPMHNACDFLSADLLLDDQKTLTAKRHLQRFVWLLFGHPFVTPDPQESAMMYAHVARLRSGDLSRQVGACIVDTMEQVLAVGFNEVPKAGGGFYDNTLPAEKDFRDWPWRLNSSMDAKKRIFKEILTFLKDNKKIDIPENYFEEGPVEELLLGLKEETTFMDILEYSRNIHAEMSALIGALNTGRSVKSATLYTTTFPCHTCTRHLVAAGIRRVCYLDPFSKSQALSLFSDSVTYQQVNAQDQRVLFEQFTGITPRKYALFEAPSREDAFGHQRPWIPTLRL